MLEALMLEKVFFISFARVSYSDLTHECTATAAFWKFLARKKN